LTYTVASSGDTAGCSVSPTGVVSFSASGTCIIDVNSAAQGAYGAAAQGEQVLTVGAVLIPTPPTPTPQKAVPPLSACS
jgi:hypothetical protein